MDHLNLAYEAWRGAASLRSRRARLKDFAYGRQWGDPARRPDGELTTEGQRALDSGATPLTNNLIRQSVKTVIGLYRRDFAREVPQALRAAADMNFLDELDARTLEEFLISGCAIQRVVSERRPAGAGLWVDIVSPARFFVNRFSDPRGNDIELAGMLHDMSVAEAVARFGGENAGRRAFVADRLLAAPRSVAPIGEPDGDDFLRAEGGKCRVIELWTMELTRAIRCFDPDSGHTFTAEATEAQKIARENARRPPQRAIVTKTVDTVAWRCRWLSPCGEVLSEYLSPWPHGSHPFAVKFYPMVDGEVHSFVEDILPQQKMVNRVLTTIGHILAASAKGVLLFPEERKPDYLSWDDICAMWSDSQGVIPYRSVFNGTNGGDMPRQVITGGATSDAHALLSTELSLMEKVSGVGDTLTGALGKNMSAEAYDAAARHSATALTDVLGAFSGFTAMRTAKMLSLATPTPFSPPLTPHQPL